MIDFSNIQIGGALYQPKILKTKPPRHFKLRILPNGEIRLIVKVKKKRADQ